MKRVGGLRSWLQPLLLAAAALAGLTIVVETAFFFTLGDLEGTSGRTVQLLDELTRATAGTAAVVLLVTAVFFIVWFHRCYSNDASAGWRLPYGTGWAIGSWFVPILNLIRPARIMLFIWHDGAPGTAPEEPAEDTGDRLVRVWWGAFLASGFIGRVMLQTLVAGTTVDDLRRSSALSAASALFDLVAALAAARLVRQISDAQDRRIDAAEADARAAVAV